MKLSKLKTSSIEMGGEKIAIRELSLSARGRVNDAMTADGQVAAMHETLKAGVPEMSDWVPATFDEYCPDELEVLASAIMDLSGLSAEAVEEAEKN